MWHTEKGFLCYYVNWKAKAYIIFIYYCIFNHSLKKQKQKRTGPELQFFDELGIKEFRLPETGEMEDGTLSLHSIWLP